MASTRKDIAFIVGMNSPALKPAEADRLLKQYLAADARLSDQTRRWISAARPARLKSPLTELMLAVDKRQVPKVDTDARELLNQVTDLIEGVTERIEALDQIESTLIAQQKIAVKGSKASDEAAQYLKMLNDARAKPEALLRQIKVPKAGDKPEQFVRQLYDSTSAVLAIGILLDVAAKGLRKWIS